MNPSQSNPAGKAQAWVLFIVAGLAIFFGVPWAIDGVMESRINSSGGCVSATYDVTSIWKMLFSSKIGDCTLGDNSYHNAWILQMQTLVLLGLLVLGLLYLLRQLVKRGPIGAKDVGGAVFVAVVGFGVLAVVAVALLVYMTVIAMVFMVVVVLGIGLFSE